MEIPNFNQEQKKPIDGFDFAASFDLRERQKLLKFIGENPYASNLRTDIGEVISNLSRTLAVGNLRNCTNEQIEAAIDHAIIGDKKGITPINFPEEKRNQVKEYILDKLKEAMG